MNSVYELLAQKEQDLTRVHKEVESLRIAATLLGDEDDESVSAPEEESRVTSSAEVGAEPSQEELPEESAVQKMMGIFRKRSA